MILLEPYRPRAIRFLGLWTDMGWRLKAYGIAYGADRPNSRLVAAARAKARLALPVPPMDTGRYGVGFVGVHEGRGLNLVFVDWWMNENELAHRVFTSEPASPALLSEITGSGLSGCVWDHALIAFECRSWVETVLAAHSPRLEEYLERRMDGTV